MCFLLEQTMKSIRKHLGINLVIAGTLFVAYLFFFVVCCYIEDGLLGLETFSFKERDRSVYYSASVLENDEQLYPEEVEDFSRQYPFLESFTMLEYIYHTDTISNQGISFYRVDEHFSDHFTIPILKGRYFTLEEIQNGSPVCVIGEGLRLQSGLDVGDSLTLGECSLKIIGVMKYNANMGANLVPYKTFEDYTVPGLRIQGYEIVATLSDASFASQINWEELGLSGEAVSCTEYFNNGAFSLLQRSSVSLLVGILVLVYALMNLLNIMVSKMDQQQKNLGIRVALGAPYWKVFLQFFFEMLILITTSVLTIFCCEPVINIFTRKYLNHYFGPFTFFTMVVVSIVTSLCLSFLVFRKFKRVEIAAAVKGV